MRLATTIGVALGMAPACATDAAQRSPSPAVRQGERALETPNRRTIEATPRHGLEEKGPFQTDRLAIEPYAAEKEAEAEQRKKADVLREGQIVPTPEDDER